MFILDLYTTEAVVKLQAEKILTWTETYDLSDTVAVLYHLSYQRTLLSQPA